MGGWGIRGKKGGGVVNRRKTDAIPPDAATSQGKNMNGTDARPPGANTDADLMGHEMHRRNTAR